MSKHICTVCGDSYSADYRGQYPICLHCQWELHSKLKEYWYCPVCDKGYLLYTGVGISPCNHTHVYQVHNILNSINLRELERWAVKEGKLFFEKVTRFMLLDSDSNCLGYSVDMQGYRTTNIVPCLKITDVPFYFESEEIASFVSEIIIERSEESSIKEVIISGVIIPTVSEDFFRCPKCEEYLCNYSLVEKYSKLNKESGKLNSGYKCSKCNTQIVACYTCNKIIIQNVEQRNTCSNYCRSKEELRLTSSNKTIRKGISLDKYLGLAKRKTNNLNCPYCEKRILVDTNYSYEQLICSSCNETINICVDCKDTFYIDYKEADWFKKRKLNLPKRCKRCRKSKR